ncbi:peptidase M42, partial [Streptococcus suis]
MKTLDYIVTLNKTPSPTGFTTDIMNYIKEEVESFGYAASKTAKGGVLVTVPGENEQEHRMVTAHLDTLGDMVRAVKPDGRLKMDLVGGFGYPS